MNIFRKLREQKGMPAAALDERFQIQRGDWDSWENGFKKPEPELTGRNSRILWRFREGTGRIKPPLATQRPFSRE